MRHIRMDMTWEQYLRLARVAIEHSTNRDAVEGIWGELARMAKLADVGREILADERKAQE